MVWRYLSCVRPHTVHRWFILPLSYDLTLYIDGLYDHSDTTSRCTSMFYMTTLIRPHTVHRWFIWPLWYYLTLYIDDLYDHSDTTSHCTSLVYMTTLIRPHTVHRWCIWPLWYDLTIDVADPNIVGQLTAVIPVSLVSWPLWYNSDCLYTGPGWYKRQKTTQPKHLWENHTN